MLRIVKTVAFITELLVGRYVQLINKLFALSIGIIIKVTFNIKYNLILTIFDIDFAIAMY